MPTKTTEATRNVASFRNDDVRWEAVRRRDRAIHRPAHVVRAGRRLQGHAPKSRTRAQAPTSRSRRMAVRASAG